MDCHSPKGLRNDNEESKDCHVATAPRNDDEDLKKARFYPRLFLNHFLTKSKNTGLRPSLIALR